MERKSFIEKDPLTSTIVSFLRDNSKSSFTVEEITGSIMGDVTTKQVQLVISLLMREGMIKASSTGGKPSYQIKS